jgi:hypothetical protein
MNWHVINVFGAFGLCLLAWLHCRRNYRDQIRDLKGWLETERDRRIEAEERVDRLTEALYKRQHKHISKWN